MSAGICTVLALLGSARNVRHPMIQAGLERALRHQSVTWGDIAEWPGDGEGLEQSAGRGTNNGAPESTRWQSVSSRASPVRDRR